MSKRDYLGYGFRQLPEVIAVSKRFTHAEKLIISKVFDLMWMNKETKHYAGQAWPSNDYLQQWCRVGKNTVIDCKKKCKALGVFDIIKRWNTSDIWILKEIPDLFVEEYEEFIDEMQDIRDMREMGNKELGNILADMDDKERVVYLLDNPELGKIS